MPVFASVVRLAYRGHAPEPELRFEGNVGATLEALFAHVHRWSCQLLGHRPEVDDATQEALVEIARALPGFRGESKLTTWARSITVRVAYRFMQPRHAHLAQDRLAQSDPSDFGNATTPEHTALAREVLQRFEVLLETLPIEQRTAFVLCAVEGLAHEEAARTLGVPIETLRARLKRARARLVSLVEGDSLLNGLVAKEPS